MKLSIKYNISKLIDTVIVMLTTTTTLLTTTTK
jgi:hypothetical protein